MRNQLWWSSQLCVLLILDFHITKSFAQLGLHKLHINVIQIVFTIRYSLEHISPRNTSSSVYLLLFSKERRGRKRRSGRGELGVWSRTGGRKAEQEMRKIESWGKPILRPEERKDRKVDRKGAILTWLVWLSELITCLGTKGFQPGSWILHQGTRLACGARFPVEGAQEATTYWCFSSFLFPSLSPSLKINK